MNRHSRALSISEKGARLSTGEFMTVHTVKLGGRKFVIIAEKDFRELKANAGRPSIKPRNSRRQTVQDRGDIAEARRREREPSVSLETVLKHAGRRA